MGASAQYGDLPTMAITQKPGWQSGLVWEPMAQTKAPRHDRGFFIGIDQSAVSPMAFRTIF